MRWFLPIFLVSLCCLSCFASTDEVVERRIHNYYLVGDYQSGLIEARAALVAHPESKPLRMHLIEGLARIGDDRAAYNSWRETSAIFNEVKTDLQVIESLAWSVLERAEFSDQMALHLSSLYGVSLTRDVRGAQVILRQLKSKNSYIRVMAVRYAMQYGDDVLLREMKKMLDTEKVWYVRLEVMRALAAHRVSGVEKRLRTLITSDRTPFEERGVAIESLVTMTDSIDEEALDNLLKSNRAGLRQLGCGILLHLEKNEWREKLIPLLDDAAIEVRCMAMGALAYLGADGLDLKEKLTELAASNHAHLSIAAARMLLSLNSPYGIKVLYEQLLGSDAAARRLAASALVASGEHGKWLALKMLKRSDDPYVRVNLALGLLGFREDDATCCQEIASFLQENNDLIMWDRTPGFFVMTLSPTRARHVPGVAQYPLLIDQSTRLSLYNALAIMRYEKASGALRNFLRNKPQGISYTAAMTLIEEGNHDALEAVKALLDDPDEMVRLQAAFAMAVSGEGKAMLPIFQEIFPRAPRDVKLHIVQALGHFGSHEVLPFLLEVMGNEFHVLRIAAASAIIQAING